MEMLKQAGGFKLTHVPDRGGAPSAKLRAEVNAVLALSEMADRLVPAGAGEPCITTLEEFNAIIRRDYETYGKVIKDVGVTVD
jgi:tripartite-type tricarboxylate transporter receptor subunit TctC